MNLKCWKHDVSMPEINLTRGLFWQGLWEALSSNSHSRSLTLPATFNSLSQFGLIWCNAVIDCCLFASRHHKIFKAGEALKAIWTIVFLALGVGFRILTYSQTFTREVPNCTVKFKLYNEGLNYSRSLEKPISQSHFVICQAGVCLSTRFSMHLQCCLTRATSDLNVIFMYQKSHLAQM